MVDFVII